MWLAVALVTIPILLHLFATNWGSYPADTLLVAVLLGVGVGFVEEIITRGIAVALLRKAGYGERAVMVLSSLIFALLHASNLATGQPILTVLITLVYTFGYGVMMYLVLRVTRHLIWPMILHGLTDPTTTLAVGGVDATTDTAGTASLIATAGLFNFIFPALAIVAIILVHGHVTNKRPNRPAKSEA